MEHRKLFVILISVGTFPFFINGYVNSIIYDSAPLYWGFEFFSWIALPVVVLYLGITKGGLKLEEVGIHREIFGRQNIFIVMLFAFVFSPLAYLLYRTSYNFFHSIFMSEPKFSYQQVVPENKLLKSLVAIYFGLSAGIVEELYFRGFLYKVASLFSNSHVYYLALSPILFSLIHWEGGMVNVLSTFLYGFIFSIVYLWIKNLWPLIAGHVFTDYVWYS